MKTLSGYVVHIGAIQGRLKVGDKVVCSLNEVRPWLYSGKLLYKCLFDILLVQ